MSMEIEHINFSKLLQFCEDLLEARDAIAEWSKLNYGFMGRTPDYKASFIGHLDAYSDYYVGFEDNAKAWYERLQEIYHLLIIRLLIHKWIVQNHSMKTKMYLYEQ